MDFGRSRWSGGLMSMFSSSVKFSICLEVILVIMQPGNCLVIQEAHAVLH